MKLKIMKLNKLAIIPKYEHNDDSGLDLFSTEDVELLPGTTQLIHTGIAIELPQGTEAQVRPRSGLALKYSITVLNTPGTVDAGYRGEVGVILINHGKSSFQVLKGMKIAQMVITPIIHVDVQEVENLSETTRGNSGFGSTGMTV
ncbi:dUTP diphosphatase [Nostoc sp. GT001]|uniref:dUTP diphosphatase n=1 Tax=Nostoc sp. GT001 TaxID=3056647 RepID=UPI0025AB4E00|nr:dUTP diphosphatase [Nostoc sp. GT001]MDM9584793.1 dUTP diphosphatase [Nostoc sp. GT001]